MAIDERSVTNLCSFGLTPDYAIHDIKRTDIIILPASGWDVQDRHEIDLQCAKSLLLSMPRGRQSGYSVLPLSCPHSDDKIRQIEEYLRGTLRSRCVDRQPR